MKKDTDLVLIDTIYAEKKYPHWKRVEVKKRFEYMGESFFVHKTWKYYTVTHVTSGRSVSYGGKTVSAAIEEAKKRLDSTGPETMKAIFENSREWYNTEGKNLEVID